MKEYDGLVRLDDPVLDTITCHIIPSDLTHNGIKRIWKIIEEHRDPNYRYICHVPRDKVRLVEVLGFKAINPHHPTKVSMELE